MKYKKGDTVKIREDLENEIFDLPETFVDLCKHAGKTAKIVGVLENLQGYTLSVDGKTFLISEYYLESDKKNVFFMSPADALKKATMIVETLNVKEFNIQCTDGIFEFTMAKDLEGK